MAGVVTKTIKMSAEEQESNEFEVGIQKEVEQFENEVQTIKRRSRKQ